MKYDREKIAEMRSKGFTYEQIALELNTTKGNISSQITMMRNQGWNIIIQKKWSQEELDYLIELRNNTNLNIPSIAEQIGRPYDRVKAKISSLIKKGIITPKGVQSSPTGSYSFKVEFTAAEQNYTNRGCFSEPLTEKDKQDLIEFVQQYKTSDACPHDIRYQIKKCFGSWSAALVEAGLPINKGTLDSNKPTTLYLIDFGDFKKYGITQRTLKQRFSGSPDYVILDQFVTDLQDAEQLERIIAKTVANKAFQPNMPYFENGRRGKTECFKGSETQLCELI